MITIKSFGSGSDGNCYIVSDGTTNIMLECGVQYVYMMSCLRKIGLSITNIQACLISHAHSDHCSCIKYIAKFDIPIICTKQTKEKNLSSLKNKEVSLLDDIHNIITIGKIQIMPLKVYHGDADCYGFIFHDNDDTILFLTDFSVMKYDLSNMKFTKIYIETNYNDNLIDKLLMEDDDSKFIKYKRQITVHCSLDNAIRYLKSFDLSKCTKIVGIHLSKELINGSLVKSQIQRQFAIPTYCIDSKGKEY